MSAISQVIINALMVLVLIFFEFVVYGAILPMILGGAIGLVVLSITGMALYESIKHRKDREPW